MAETFPNLKETLNTQIQELQRNKIFKWNIQIFKQKRHKLTPW